MSIFRFPENTAASFLGILSELPFRQQALTPVIQQLTAERRCMIETGRHDACDSTFSLFLQDPQFS